MYSITQYTLEKLISFLVIISRVIIGLVISTLINSTAFAAKSAHYIYIDASEGNASGGHVAIRFDNDVYHYEYVDPGLIKLDKQTVNDFEFTYRFLENRSLHLSQLAISEQTYTQLRDHFDFRFQVQKQHYALLTELNREQELLQFLSNQPMSKAELLQIPAAGLFYSQQDFSNNLITTPPSIKDKAPSILSNVQQKIQTLYGKQYIEQRLQQLVKSIKQMQPTPWTEQSIHLKEKQFPEMTYTFANRYVDAMTAWMALTVIQQQRPLRPDVYRTSNNNEFVLSAELQTAMQEFSGILQDNILSLLQSSRPDWGSALLVNLGRLLVLEQSIKQHQLVVLDNTDTTSATEDFNQDEIRSLYEESRKFLQQVKNKFKKQGRQQEVLYSHLEWQANRFLALSKTEQEHDEVTLYRAKRIPGKSLPLPKKIIPQLTDRQLKRDLQKLKKVTIRYQHELDSLYRYNLLHRNCVTELFMTIDQAISTKSTHIKNETQTNKNVKQQSTQLLGGYVSMEPTNFIPFLSHHEVNNQYQISEQRTLPSYRLQKLQNFYSQDNKLTTFLRESNTLSSSLYKANSTDSFFVFFTDEQLLLRPFFGIVNTLAGLSQSVYGLFSLPFDSGHHLQSGISGLIMSLPELVFINIRKGSFNHLPYSTILTADETITQKMRESSL